MGPTRIYTPEINNRQKGKVDAGRFIANRGKLFDEQAAKIGEIRHIDESLFILIFAIARNPDPFLMVPGFENIKIAKTDAYSRKGVPIPPLRIWFRKIDENIIELLAIEPYEKQNDE